MKKFIFMYISLCAFYANAQDYHSSISLEVGPTEKGVGLKAEYGNYASRFNNSSLNVAAFISFAQYSYENDKIYSTLYSIQMGYTLDIWENYQHTIRVGILGGGIIGYESINNGNKVLGPNIRITDDSKLIYGLYAGAELDVSIATDLSVVLRANESYHINSDLGNVTPYVGAGLRFYF